MPTSPAAEPAIPIPASAAQSIRRQNEFLVQVVTEMSQNEEKRSAALAGARNKKARKEMERRFNAERGREVERVSRLKDEATTMKKMAEEGSYSGTKLDRSRGAVKPVNDKEVTGLQSRGGLTDGQYKFLKQVYTKFEAPLPPRPSERPRAPNISFYKEQRAHAKVARIESQRLGLLNQKRELLTQLTYVIDKQDALINRNEWGSTARSSYRR